MIILESTQRFNSAITNLEEFDFIQNPAPSVGLMSLSSDPIDD